MILKRIDFIFIHCMLRISDERRFKTLQRIKREQIAPTYITT